MEISAKTAESWLTKEYPSWLQKLPEVPGAFVQVMPRGVAFHAGEVPVTEVPCPPLIAKHFPGTKFYSSKVRTNAWDISGTIWPVIVVVMPKETYLSFGSFVSLQEIDPSTFFTPFAGEEFSGVEQLTFAQELAHLVFQFQLHDPCDRPAIRVSATEITVREDSYAPYSLLLHVYFDSVNQFRGARIAEDLAGEASRAGH